MYGYAHRSIAFVAPMLLPNVDPEMRTSQNGYGGLLWAFSQHDKNIKLLIIFIFYHRTVVKQYHHMTHWLSYSKTVLWCSRCKSHRYVAAPLRHLLILLQLHGMEIRRFFIHSLVLQKFSQCCGLETGLVQHSNLALSINFYHYLWVANHFMLRFHLCTLYSEYKSTHVQYLDIYRVRYCTV